VCARAPTLHVSRNTSELFLREREREREKGGEKEEGKSRRKNGRVACMYIERYNIYGHLYIPTIYLHIDAREPSISRGRLMAGFRRKCNLPSNRHATMIHPVRKNARSGRGGRRKGARGRERPPSSPEGATGEGRETERKREKKRKRGREGHRRALHKPARRKSDRAPNAPVNTRPVDRPTNRIIAVTGRSSVGARFP